VIGAAEGVWLAHESGLIEEIGVPRFPV